MNSEVTNYADFTKVRYAQCWEDADVLMEALDVHAGGTYLSIASAGDNSLSMLAYDPAKVIAADLNPAQIACVQLRAAAYKFLEYQQMLEFCGIRPCKNRLSVYNGLRKDLPVECAKYWDAHTDDIKTGFYNNGKFENYFSLFRKVMKFIHSDKTVDKLLASKSVEQRREFYEKKWNNFQWKLLFRIFFSKHIMGKYGRDPAFFRYVDVPVSERILSRTRYALTELDTSENPYLHYILKGKYGESLPHSLREENFNKIKNNIDRLEIKLWSVETALENMSGTKFSGFNLSDIFEYMSEDAMENIYRKLIDSSEKNARIVYWNMLAPRSLPESLSTYAVKRPELEKELFAKDKAFFYSALRIEQIS